MNISRRAFLVTMLAAPAALVALSKATAKPPTPVKWVIPPLSEILGPGYDRPLFGAIKVSSNRWCYDYATADEDSVGHYYHGDWDGTFKLESGCTNPAYILADLTERLGGGHDWVTHGGRLDYAGRETDRNMLNWQMIYDYGVWCDELITGYQVTDGNLTSAIARTGACPPTVWWKHVSAPRMTVKRVCQTHEQMVALHETLRMHCLQWQSTDSRYRTSWPGVPYFKEMSQT